MSAVQPGTVYPKHRGKSMDDKNQAQNPVPLQYAIYRYRCKVCDRMCFVIGVTTEAPTLKGTLCSFKCENIFRNHVERRIPLPKKKDVKQ
jgi:hypothetical protein